MSDTHISVTGLLSGGWYLCQTHPEVLLASYQARLGLCQTHPEVILTSYQEGWDLCQTHTEVILASYQARLDLCQTHPEVILASYQEGWDLCQTHPEVLLASYQVDRAYVRHIQKCYWPPIRWMGLMSDTSRSVTGLLSGGWGLCQTHPELLLASYQAGGGFTSNTFSSVLSFYQVSFWSTKVSI